MLNRERLLCILTPADADAMLGETSAISIDYNNTKPLVAGTVTSFMGFDFVVSHRLEQDTHLTAEGFARNIVLVPSAMKVAMNRRAEVRIGEDPSERFDKIIYAAVDFGSVRMQEEKVVVIESYRA
jgi:hypothetical protein